MSLGWTAAAIIIGAVVVASATVYSSYNATQQSKKQHSLMLDAERANKENQLDGQLTADEVRHKAKTRAYRSGQLFTNASGLGDDPNTGSAKIQ